MGNGKSKGKRLSTGTDATRLPLVEEDGGMQTSVPPQGEASFTKSMKTERISTSGSSSVSSSGSDESSSKKANNGAGSSPIDARVSAKNSKTSGKKNTKQETIRESLLDRPKEGGESKLRTLARLSEREISTTPTLKNPKRVASQLNPDEISKSFVDYTKSQKNEPLVPNSRESSIIKNLTPSSNTKNKHTSTTRKKHKHTSTSRTKHSSTTHKHTSTTRGEGKHKKHTSSKAKPVGNLAIGEIPPPARKSTKHTKREKSKGTTTLKSGESSGSKDKHRARRSSRNKARKSHKGHKTGGSRESTRKERDPESKAASAPSVADGPGLAEIPLTEPVMETTEPAEPYTSKLAGVFNKSTNDDESSSQAPPDAKKKRKLSMRVSGLLSFKGSKSTDDADNVSVEPDVKQKRKLSMRLADAVRRISFTGKVPESRASEDAPEDVVNNDTHFEKLNSTLEPKEDSPDEKEKKKKNKLGQRVSNKLRKASNSFKEVMLGPDSLKESVESEAWIDSYEVPSRKGSAKEGNVLRYQDATSFLQDQRQKDESDLKKIKHASKVRDTLDALEVQALLDTDLENSRGKDKKRRKKPNNQPGARDTLDILELEALAEIEANGNKAPSRSANRRAVPSILLSKSVDLNLPPDLLEEATKVEEEAKKAREVRRSELKKKREAKSSKLSNSNKVSGAKTAKPGRTSTTKANRSSTTKPNRSSTTKPNRSSATKPSRTSTTKANGTSSSSHHRASKSSRRSSKNHDANMQGIPKKSRAKQTARSKVKSFVPEPGYLADKKTEYLGKNPKNKEETKQTLGKFDY